CQHYYDNALTF
nr:immunoglobulin light chain junction region [Macaca mulatta]MOV62640.1 immunoglobulin light chain junction region [Macaca mulatta]MOV65151.1 immunoglobulin light chain junction region [Macaca mulatta]